MEATADDLIDQTVREMDDDQLELEDETAPTGDSIYGDGQEDNDDDYGDQQRAHFQVLNEDESPEEEE